MKISSLFKQGRPVFSFEIFPPKKDGSIEAVYKTLDGLTDLKPDFISVTYGAGGNTPAGCSTREIVCIIKEKYHTESIAHLTCVNSTREDIDRVIGEFESCGIENVLALRGDINPDIPPREDFKHASELISYMKQRSGLSFSGACYPEGHTEAKSLEEDIENLKKKVDAGAEHLISQLFFDNHHFYEFLDKARAAGINVPIEAGIMPCVNANQIQRMVTMCGASLPPKFTKIMARFESNPEAMRDAGIAYAIDQIIDLAANGVDGIHLYTMNNPYVARKISKSVESVLLG
ncbi:MAG: methylenetetrahydrofolate reductase [NAD(P)H] [Oscillospiraceae bacterium]|nr:methylenetetrahydrofolate reductase [NAD(P)H] [Oscillospiraceae bacterium]